MIRFLTVATMLSLLAFGAGPASAQLDRTDLADGSWTQTSTSTGAGPSTFARARGGFVFFTNSGPFAIQFASAFASGGTTGVGAASNMGNALIGLILYEPEKVGRKADQLKMQQKTGVGAFVSMNAVGSIATTIPGTSIVIQNCSMKAQAKGIAGGAANKMQAKIKCPDITGGAGLNLNANQEAALSRILGLAAINDKELTVKTTAATYTP